MTEVIIDFEGCRRKGIRQIGIIQSQDLNIIKTWDVDIIDQKDIRSILMEALQVRPSVMIAHNSQVEKNLLREYLPYKNLGSQNGNGRLCWGPWIDTKEVYGLLYPKIKNYALVNLTSTFIHVEELTRKLKVYCEAGKRKPHFAMYDVLCTYLLIKRIAAVADITKFAKD
jgi:DNA polymerase III epsilon subunit-like protein